MEPNDPQDQPGPPPPPPLPPEAGTPGAPPPEERQWAMFAHLSIVVGGLLTGALGGAGTFLGPLVIWLMRKDTMPFVADQAKEALNFSITITGIMVVLWLLTIVTFGLGGILTVPVMVIIGLAALVLSVLAGMKANEGVAYRYPYTLRLVK